MNQGRNEPCACGSGRKFKHCCGRDAAAVAAAPLPPDRHIGELANLVGRGRLAEAEARAAARLALEPANGALWKVLSVALLRQGKDALPALRQAARLLPQDAEAYANLGAALQAHGEAAAALDALRHCLTLDARNPDVLAQAGDLQRALGRPREAVMLYQWARQLEPLRAELHNNLANALLEQGEPAEAVGSYQRALQLRPKDAQILCNLGNALRQLGRWDEAINATQAALALAPGLSMAHNNLGLLLTATGQAAQAAASYREALRLTPGYPEACLNLGNLLRATGNRREALELFAQAVALNPQRGDSHYTLGHALLESRRVAEATASFRAALALQPGNVPAHLGLAAALRVQGQFAQAETSCEAALALEPANAGALALLGELYADRGRFAEAQDHFERAVAADPTLASAFGSIAAHRRMTRADTKWLAGTQALLGRGLPLDQQVHLHYALGKYFDDVGEFDQAFGNYAQANELSKRNASAYDPARLTALVGRVMALCDPAFVRTGHAQASASQLPLLIVGMPRSGTSLTEQILASHPEVYGAGELRFWDRAFAIAEKERAAGAAAPLAELARDYLALLGARSGAAARVTDKMPANFLYLGLIHAAFPRARIIHMQRDPLDTCVSVYFQNFFNVSPYANDLEHLAHYYAQYLRISAYWRQLLPAEVLLEVPYEGLVADPEVWTRRMLDFAGLPWDPRCLEFQDTERVVITASKWQVRQKISAGSIGRWRRYERHLGPLLQLAAAARQA